MTRVRGVACSLLFASFVVLLSCQGFVQKSPAPEEGNMRVVKLIIPEWENDGTAGRVRSTLSGLEGVLSLSEIPRIGQVTVTYDESKVTLEQMEKALNEKGVTVTQRSFLK